MILHAANGSMISQVLPWQKFQIIMTTWTMEILHRISWLWVPHVLFQRGCWLEDSFFPDAFSPKFLLAARKLLSGSTFRLHLPLIVLIKLKKTGVSELLIRPWESFLSLPPHFLFFGYFKGTRIQKNFTQKMPTSGWPS